jgi:hypothetical protein
MQIVVELRRAPKGTALTDLKRSEFLIIADCELAGGVPHQ